MKVEMMQMNKIENMIKMILVATGVIFFSNYSLAMGSDLEITVDQFLEALRNGDTGALIDVFSEKQLKCRRKLMNNPRYSDFLRGHYENCEFQIKEIRQLSEFNVEVYVEIVSGGQISSAPTFRFSKKNRKWKFTGRKKEF